MCGIAGKVYFNNRYVRQSDLLLMAQKIAHRGPDNKGFFITNDKKLGLLNRRLAIIDLSRKGNQPMKYMNRYVITYNGEIYNFIEKRKHLEKKGYKFNSNSDSEVILALYDKYKFRCLEHLRGMFAFAIYDETEKTLFLARDRIGKKPLKYYQDENTFIFASELKAILTQNEVKKEPDVLSIHNYLTYGYVPSPNTGFKKIYKLEPGHYLLINLKNKSFENKSYWKLSFKEKLHLSESEWCNLILKELEESTKLRMISDVPFGAFLSGGVDSSSVVATMALFSRNPIKTFTIGFRNKKNDERTHAERIVKLYNTQHHTLIAEPENIENILPELSYYYEEPFADSSAVVTYMICKLAKKLVTVVLTGDGGDENFAGYDHRMKRLQRDIFFDNFKGLITPLGFSTSSLALKIFDNSFLRKVNKFLEKSKIPLSHRYLTYNCIFTNLEKSQLYSNEFINTTKNNNSYIIASDKFSESDAEEQADKALFYDLTSWLPDSQLTKVDIASMSVSLELRSPYLDYRFIELAAKIPFNLKVKGNEYKYILKKAVEKIVPKENLYRRKIGFAIPLDRWFKGNLNKYGSMLLLNKNSYAKNIFNQQEIKRMFKEHDENKDFGAKLWSLMMLELWYKNYF